jgi:hypothetical protein
MTDIVNLADYRQAREDLVIAVALISYERKDDPSLHDLAAWAAEYRRATTTQRLELVRKGSAGIGRIEALKLADKMLSRAGDYLVAFGLKAREPASGIDRVIPFAGRSQRAS